MVSKQWCVYDKIDDTVLNRLNVHPVVAQISANRGYNTPKDVFEFINTDLSEHPFNRVDPNVLTDMDVAVERILKAVFYNEPIAIYGDFDADGITSTALMYLFLKKLRANVIYYIPHRIDEGYGMNPDAMQHLASIGIKLVLTVDCGIRAHESVAAANQYGMDVVITDHHELGPTLPEGAVAIVNPQRNKESNLSNICGVAVAYTVAIGILKHLWIVSDEDESVLAYGMSVINEFEDIVAIGTVADVMSLKSPINRYFVKRGVVKMNRNPRMGIRAILQKAKIREGGVDVRSIGFAIGPRLNAAGRVGDVYKAVQILASSDAREVEDLALEIERCNKERQQQTRMATKSINEMLERSNADDTNIIIIQHDIHPGVVGLVASRVSDQYYRPTIVMEKGDTQSKASCRSIEEFPIINALEEASDLLVRYGGHTLAAGLTIDNNNVEAFMLKMADIAQRDIGHLSLSPKLHIDAELSFDQLSEELIAELQVFEPTGHQNPQPVFVTYGLHVLEWRAIGSDLSHLKMKLYGGSGNPLSAIAFGFGHLAHQDEAPLRADVVYNLELNEWEGRVSVQLNIKDVIPHYGD